jgi:undecaprenyl diphosphate synthase
MDTKPIHAVGIIMDGNRRWAKERGLPSFEGHRAGVAALRALRKEFPRLRERYGLECVYLYAFSTENWNRAKDEVELLLRIFESGLSEIIDADSADPRTALRVKVIGQRDRFSPRLRKLMDDVEAKTAQNGGGTAVFCLSYGGRAEIVEAANRLIAAGKEVSEEEFSGHLWTAGMPDPDLIVRTSGERRLSNFLPWQGVYAELFFTPTYWPDFTAYELEKIFDEYQERERRHGA